MRLVGLTSVTSLAATTDTFTWSTASGSFWGIASNWQDTTVGAVAESAPGASSIVSITGGIGDAFTNISGNGAAAQVSIAQDVLLWGTIGVGGTLTLGTGQSATELDLDGGALLTAGNVVLDGGGDAGGRVRQHADEQRDGDAE